MRIPHKNAISIIFGLLMAASAQAQFSNTAPRTLLLTNFTRITAAHTNVTVALTNRSIVSGALISQSSSNITIASFGEQMNIPRSLISAYELRAVPAAQQVDVDTGQWTDRSTRTSQAPPNAILAECFKPHSESEMRTLLQTPEGQILLKNVSDSYIGAGTDPQTMAAKDSYFKVMQEFASGGIGIAEIQSSAQDTLGQLNKYAPEMSTDPQAARWIDSKEKLQWFTRQPAFSSNSPVKD
jgi:hypothetical protein